MDELVGKVEQWQAAGLVDSATAERILAFEQDRMVVKRAGEGRPGMLEAFLYLGLLILALGLFQIAATTWDQLESWARVVLVGIPTGLTFVLGAALRLSPEASIRRGGQMAWLVSVALLAALVLVVGDEYGPGVESAGPRVTAGTVTMVYAALLWALWPRHLQVVAFAGALAFFGQMLGSWPDDFNQQLAGGSLLVLSAGALALTELDRMLPKASSRLAFALVLVAGGLEMQAESAWYWEPWVIVAGAALVGLSLRRSTFTYMVVGMGGIFAGFVMVVSEHLGDRLGGQLAFTLGGAIIIGGALVIAQLSRRFRVEKG